MSRRSPPASAATSTIARWPRSPASTSASCNSALDRLVERRARLPPRHGRPTPPIRSSMRWCATPRPTACCAASFAGSMPASPRRSRPSRSQPPPELIAWHAELAGLDRKAVDYLLLAGCRAIGRYANQEAIHHLERALRLIAALPEEAEQAALELRALAMVGVPRIALHGYASTRGRGDLPANRRARRTGRRHGAALPGAARPVELHLRPRRSRECPARSPSGSARWRSITRRPRRRALAYRALGAACLSLGRLQEAIAAFEKGVEACAGLPADAGLREHGESPLIIAGVYAGFAHTIAGDFDRGQAFIDDALAAVRRLQYPLSFAFAHHIAANTQYLLDAPAECARLSAEILARRRGTSPDLLAGRRRRDGRLGGDALRTAMPRASTACAAGLHAWQTSGAELHIPTWHAAVPMPCWRQGRSTKPARPSIAPWRSPQSARKFLPFSVLLRLKGLVADRQGDAEAAQSFSSRRSRWRASRARASTNCGRPASWRRL